MKAKVLIRFNGQAEKKTFEVGKTYDFEPERAAYLAALGFVQFVENGKKSEDE